MRTMNHAAFEIYYHITFQNLKTVSSRYIRKEYAEHLSKYFGKPYFWSKSYGVKSISRGADLTKIIEYVRNQEKPTQ